MNKNPISRLRRKDFESFCLFAGFRESLYNHDVINLVQHPALPFGQPLDDGHVITLSEASSRVELGKVEQPRKRESLLAKDANTTKDWFTRWRLLWVNDRGPRERFYSQHKRLQNGETDSIVDGHLTHNCYRSGRICDYAWLLIIEFAMWKQRKDRVLRLHRFADGDFIAQLYEFIREGQYTYDPNKPFLQWLNLRWGWWAKDEKKRIAREQKYVSPAVVNASGAAVSMFAFNGIDEDGHLREWSQRDISDIVELNDYAYLSLENRDDVYQRLPIGPERMTREYLRFRFPHVPRYRVWTKDANGNSIEGCSIEELAARAKAQRGDKLAAFVDSKSEEWAWAIRHRLTENGVSAATIKRHLDRFAADDTAALWRRRAAKDEITDTDRRRLARHAEDRAQQILADAKTADLARARKQQPNYDTLVQQTAEGVTNRRAAGYNGRSSGRMVPTAYWEPNRADHAEARERQRQREQKLSLKEREQAKKDYGIAAESEKRKARQEREARAAEKVEAGRFKNGARVWHETLSPEHGPATFRWQFGNGKRIARSTTNLFPSQRFTLTFEKLMLTWNGSETNTLTFQSERVTGDQGQELFSVPEFVSAVPVQAAGVTAGVAAD